MVYNALIVRKLFDSFFNFESPINIIFYFNCISCYVFPVLPKFVNFYLGRHKAKNRIRSKKTRYKKKKTKSTL